MQRRVWSIALLLVFLGSFGLTRAQSGGLEIVVRNAADGAPLAGAEVTLSHPEQFIATTKLFADEAGIAFFPVLRSGGGYVVEIQLAEYAGRRIDELRVQSNAIKRVDVLLSTAVFESVSVNTARSIVDLTEVGNRTKFDDIFLENLPIPNRQYQQILTLSPGVKDDDGDGNPNVHGARSRDFRAEVGGVGNTDPLTGEWLSLINLDAIEELQVLTTGAGVEYGRASGGFANIMQKQGGNNFEGVASFIYRSSVFDGDGAGNRPTPEFRWLQPSVQLTGPLIRDRAWFRFSFEYVDREDPIQFLDRSETQIRKQTIQSYQLTSQLSPRNKVSLKYAADPLHIERFDLSANSPGSATTDLDRSGQTISLTWTAPYSSKLLVESVVAYQNHGQDIVPSDEGVPNNCVLFGVFGSDLFGSLNKANCLDTNSGRLSGTSNESSFDKRQRLTVRSQVTYFAPRFLGMSHRFKLGLVVENERYFRRIERNPTIRFNTESLPLGGVIGNAEVRIAAPNFSEGRATGVNTALFIEDQFRPIQNLTITAGLRYDREEINSDGFSPFDPEAEANRFLEISNLQGGIVADVFDVFTKFNNINGFRRDLGLALDVNQNSIPLGALASGSVNWFRARKIQDINLVNHNLSPRLSVAWDPFGDGKTKLMATAGRYYDKIFLAVPLVEIEPPETNFTFRALPFGGSFAIIDRNPSFVPSISIQTVDHDLRTPYQNEFTVGFERALWQETSIRVTYVRRRFLDQLQDLDLNHAVDDRGRCVIPFVFGDRPVVGSPGAGALLTDPTTGEQYIDTDPGVGDGRIDDCTGDVVLSGTPLNVIQTEVPDGLADLYVQNPGWGEILTIGNFNRTDYRAMVVELVRRQYRNWQMNLSYTFSKATGNAEDFDQLLGNERNLIEDEAGFLSFDQRHVAQLSAITLTPWGIRLGGTIRWESGLPFSDLVSKSTVFGRAPELLNAALLDQKFRLRFTRNQRNDQRNPAFWTVDMRLAKEFRSSLGLMQLTVEVFNLLGDDTVRLEDRIQNVNAGTRRFGRKWQMGLRFSF